MISGVIILPRQNDLCRILHKDDLWNHCVSVDRLTLHKPLVKTMEIKKYEGEHQSTFPGATFEDP